MRLRPANIRLINRRKSYLDRYPLYLRKANNHETQHQHQHPRINKGIDSSLHIRSLVSTQVSFARTPDLIMERASSGVGMSHTGKSGAAIRNFPVASRCMSVYI